MKEFLQKGKYYSFESVRNEWSAKVLENDPKKGHVLAEFDTLIGIKKAAINPTHMVRITSITKKEHDDGVQKGKDAMRQRELAMRQAELNRQQQFLAQQQAGQQPPQATQPPQPPNL